MADPYALSLMARWLVMRFLFLNIGEHHVKKQHEKKTNVTMEKTMATHMLKKNMRGETAMVEPSAGPLRFLPLPLQVRLAQRPSNEGLGKVCTFEKALS